MKDLERAEIKQRLQKLGGANTVRFLTQVAFDWAIIIGAIAISGIVNHFGVYVLALILVGARQHGLSILFHDGAHYLVAKNKFLNDLLTRLFCAWPCFFALAPYREFHFGHHRHLRTENDPELRGFRRFSPYWDLPKSPMKLTLSFLFECCGGAAYWGICNARPTLNSSKLGDRIGAPVFCLSAAILLWYYQLTWALLLYCVSYFTTMQAISRFRVWTEHAGSLDTHRISASWWQRLLLLPHNTWCHFEHHKWSYIPACNLPKARLLDRSIPVMPLRDLLHLFSVAPHIPSGSLPPPESTHPQPHQ